MPLRKQVIPATFSAGMDAGGTDPKLVSDGLLRLENAIFPRKGTIAKRHGSSVLNETFFSGDTIITKYKENPVLFGSQGQIYNGSTDISGSFDTISLKASPVTDIVATSETMTSGLRYTACDMCVSGDLRMVMGIDVAGTTVYWFLKNRYSDAIILTGTISSTVYAKCIAQNGAIYIIYISSNVLKYHKFNSSGTQTVTAGTIAGTYAPNGTSLDAIALTTDVIAIAYNQQTTFDAVAIAWNGATNTVAGEYRDTTPSNSASLVCVWKWYEAGVDTGEFGFAYNNLATDTLYAVVLSVAAATVYGAAVTFGTAIANMKRMTAVQEDDGGQALGDTTHYIFIQTKASNAQPTIVTVVFTETGGTTAFSGSSPVTSARNALFVSRPITHTGSARAYLPCYFQGAGWWKSSPADYDKATTQRHLFLMYVSSATVAYQLVPAGKALLGEAGYSLSELPALSSNYASHTMVSGCFQDPDSFSAWQVPVLRRTGDTTIGVARLDIDLAFSNSIPREGNDVVTVPCSQGYEYNGSSVMEAGFCYFPEGITVTTSGTSASWGRTGKVGFCALYEWTDSKGNRHQSAPSPVFTHTLTATNTGLVVTVPTYAITRENVENDTDVKIVIYRTQVDGSIFYRQQSLANDITAATVSSASSIDNNGDTLTYTNDTQIVPIVEVLYTQDGTLANDQPHSHRISCIFQNRYFYVHRDYEDTLIKYTREFFAGQNIFYSDSLEIKVPPDGGAIKALAVLDEKLIIFKADRTFAMGGSGPNDLGTNATYERPRLVSSSIGCTNVKSVLQVPQGLMFMSKEGIFLLGHNEQMSFVGANAKYFTDTYTINSANVITQDHYAIWTMTSGPALVFDYLYQQWGVFTDGYSSATAAIEANGVLYWRKSASMYVQNRSLYTDNSSAYSLLLETGWFSFAQLLGYFRLYKTVLLGDNIAAHKLRIRTSYNHEPYWSDSQLFDPVNLDFIPYTEHLDGTSTSGQVDESYKVEVHGSRQKCDAVRFQISDENPTGGTRGQAFAITGISFLVGIKRGLTKLGSGRNVST